MRHSVRLTQAQREARDRRLYRLAWQHQVVTLTKRTPCPSGVQKGRRVNPRRAAANRRDTAGRQDADVLGHTKAPTAAAVSGPAADASAAAGPAETPPQVSIMTGDQLSAFHDGTPDVVYRRNLTLSDENGRVLLQRFGPSSYGVHKAMKTEMLRGRYLYDQVVLLARCHKHVLNRRTRSIFPHYHFGAWFPQGQTYLRVTSETLQRRNKDGQLAVAAFLAWLRNYVSCFVQPLTNVSSEAMEHHTSCQVNEGERNDALGQQLHPTFCKEFKQREEHYKWLQQRLPDADCLCHPLFSTCSPFHGFSEKAHIDTNDLPGTILLNFGAHALLHLTDYGTKVELTPGDIVFLDAHSVRHRTEPHPVDAGNNLPEANRWAVSCFYRTGIRSQYETVDISEGDLRTMMAREAESYSKPRARKSRRC
ncbi:uncharacterized protein PFL1_04443 [Pseudozyma flocculosa PF-1]|uniref:Uncharacterized protein n=1 Tax=Pseudozyma flocculosa PF-1 TaxID=1277687 RepID=A0A061HBY1_9BASI|nr:uncharacterized protein PFL1_04443 [Pseudozyma flocculosa PF-1]EPQ28116.1 hypothetical protein PFL1_04443 [Pseudozyma flocculosa PF-1]